MEQTKLPPLAPRFKNFEAMVLYFNGLYKLPVAPYPTLEYEAAWQSKRILDGDILTTRALVSQRFDDFFEKILVKELKEHEDIDLHAPEIDVLTDLADLLGDIIVYCASEMLRYGIPVMDVLKIIMDSNFSKLDANGNPIYDENGKVCKGPYYWKPEPQIKALLLQLIEEHKNGPAQTQASNGEAGA